MNGNVVGEKIIEVVQQYFYRHAPRLQCVLRFLAEEYIQERRNHRQRKKRKHYGKDVEQYVECNVALVVFDVGEEAEVVFHKEK